MNLKYNTDIVAGICENNNYYLISKYISYHKPIIVTDKLGYVYKTTLNKVINNKHIQFVGKHNPYTIQNIKLWCKLNDKPFDLISDKYISPHENLEWQCLKDGCGEIFEMPWSRASQDYGCGYCHGKQVGLSNCLAIKYPDIAKEWHPTLNGDLTPYDKTWGSRTDIWWKCLECGYEWFVKINSRTTFNTGCPECNKSKGEKEISKYLLNKNIIFIPQKEFEGLIGLGNGNLSYDFYLPRHKLLIEYQGEQHEKFCKGFHETYEDFQKQLEHDRRKREYAQIYNINLLEIWYYDFDNIEEILDRELKNMEV